MDRSRTASDKIRPFLEAMERSIDKVRNKRLQESGEAASQANQNFKPTLGKAPVSNQSSPASPQPQNASHHDSTMIGRSENPTTPPGHPVHPGYVQENENVDGEQPKRLKAKAKRPNTFSNSSYNQDNFHSQTG